MKGISITLLNIVLATSMLSAKAAITTTSFTTTTAITRLVNAPRASVSYPPVKHAQIQNIIYLVSTTSPLYFSTPPP
jgi:hypothetical protein